MIVLMHIVKDSKPHVIKCSFKLSAGLGFLEVPRRTSSSSESYLNSKWLAVVESSGLVRHQSSDSINRDHLSVCFS